MKNTGSLSVFILVFFFQTHSSLALEQPLLTLSDITYEGGFRLPAATYGSSSLNYSEGPIEYNHVNHSIFIVGHAHHQNIAEFSIPGLSKSMNLADLPVASAPLQNFVPVLSRVTGGNPQGLDRIGGMEFFADETGGKLAINAYEYYDAPGDNSQTTLITQDSTNLESCTVDGYYTFSGGAGHTSGWLSPVPAEWKSHLGGDTITGQSSGIPIISRTSVGPSAFAFNKESLLSSPIATPVQTTKLLDFSLAHPLNDDLSNTSGTNTIWTHLSRVIFGMIVPGTQTYLTIGNSGGHSSGVCYKCEQTNGNGQACGGYCANDVNDYYHYYWLWDVNDLMAVKNGTKNSYDIRPYNYGVFPTPFATNSFGGGTYDPATQLLYLTVQKADRLQGTYSNPPVVVAFSFTIKRSRVVAPANHLLLGRP